MITRRSFVALLGGVALGFGLISKSDASQTGQLVFGFNTRQGSSLSKFPKWRGAVRKYFENDLPLRHVSCGRTRIDACELQDWETFLDRALARNLGLFEKLDAVNREMNLRNYVLDDINWGVSDYWASPVEFFVKNGDCEDYAISKYFSLRALGVDADSMRVIVLLDQNLKVPHAVLAVETPSDVLILDNQIQHVISHSRIHHYRPIYDVSENFWSIYSRS